MGYYGSFDFDVRIPAAKVGAALEALKNTAEFQSDVEGCNGDLARVLDNYLYEAECYFQKNDALTQLAGTAYGGELRGDVIIEGGSYQKWRSWHDLLFDVLAPFVTPDSCVHIKGEEGEEVYWRFEDGERTEDWAEKLYEADLVPLRKAEAALKALILLAQTNGTITRDSFVSILAEHREDLAREML